MNNLQAIKKELISKQSQINNLKFLVGFDGFIDNIIRVVKSRANSENYTLFHDISEFARHIHHAAGKSCDMEIIFQETKLGGNGPIMANALGTFGLRGVCIGGLGYPNILDPFRVMSSHCDLLSIGPSSQCFAFEFNDGKVMFGDSTILQYVNWNTIQDKVGLTDFISLIEDLDLLAMVNWSLLDNVDTIWEGILEEVLPNLEHVPKRVFFDLADPAKRSDLAINKAIKLIERFTKFTNTTLGLNENEANRVFGAIYKQEPKGITIEEICHKIYQALDVTSVIVHPVGYSVASYNGKVVRREGFVVDKPLITTGGGDNFNAGLCLGIFLGLPIGDALTVAMAASSFYVKYGHSASVGQLISYLDALAKGRENRVGFPRGII